MNMTEYEQSPTLEFSEEDIERIVREGHTSSMNIVDGEETVLAAMAKIEGQNWLVEQSNEDRPHTVASQRKIFQSGFAQIYGSGGVNRWFVDQEGTVFLSAAHTSPLERKRVVRQVVSLGFGIRP